MFGGQADKTSIEHGCLMQNNRQVPFRTQVLEVVSIETEIKETVTESAIQFRSSVCVCVCVCVCVQ